MLQSPHEPDRSKMEKTYQLPLHFRVNQLLIGMGGDFDQPVIVG